VTGGSRLSARRALLAFLFAGAIVSGRTAMQLNVPGQPRVERYGLQDFRDNFYYPAVAARDGRNPYDYADYQAHYPIDRPLPAYTPINFLVHRPLAWLPYGAAEAADILLNLGLILATAWLALRGADITARSRGGLATGGIAAGSAAALLFAACLVLSRPGQMTIFLGQTSALMAFGTTLALVDGRRHPLRAAGGLALTCLKPSYGGPLGVLMFLRGDFRAVGIGGLLAAGAALLGSLGPMRAAGGFYALLDSARGSMTVVTNDASFNEATSLIRIDPLAILGRLLGRPMGFFANLAVALSVLLLAGAAILWLERRRGEEARPLSDTLVCLAILLATYHQPYDGLSLALPLAVAATLPELSARRRTVLLALLLVPCANFIATHTVLEHLTLAPPLWLLVSSLNGLALTAALLMTLGEVLRLSAASRPLPAAASP
jgi:hypothetical protein